jgi:hypothetical protein
VSSANGHQAEPYYLVCQGDPSWNGRLRQIRKEIAHCSCPVVHRTVRCVHGQKATIGLPNGAPTAPSCLGAIKGTPRRMEKYTNHLLNILRHRDLTFVHLIHCVRDLNTFLSCIFVVLLSCAHSSLVCVLVLRLSLLCVFLFPPYSCGFIVIYLVRVRGSNLWRFFTKGINLR